jgi:hypothetical protein
VIGEKKVYGRQLKVESEASRREFGSRRIGTG